MTLKERLKSDLSHVETVYFDREDNWYLRKSTVTVREMTRDEILKDSKIKEPGEIVTDGEQPEKRSKKR